MSMTIANLRSLWRILNRLENEKLAKRFRSMGDGSKVYTETQKGYALSFIDEYGVRATARMLDVPRRTIQRWCRVCHKPVKRCPAWVYDWAYRRHKRREFWRRRGYYYSPLKKHAESPKSVVAERVNNVSECAQNPGIFSIPVFGICAEPPKDNPSKSVLLPLISKSLSSRIIDRLSAHDIVPPNVEPPISGRISCVNLRRRIRFIPFM